MKALGIKERTTRKYIKELVDTEAFALRLVKAGICVTAQRIPEAMHGFTTNRTPGWEYALKKHIQFFREHLQEDNS